MNEKESDPELLVRLGDDAFKWAAAFRKTAIDLGYSDMDERWLAGWFTNMIESSHETRKSRRMKRAEHD
jgi:ribosomal protein S2